jgi:hypothetical protein
MNEGLRFQKVDTVPLTDWLSLGLNLMIIDGLDFVSAALAPHETDSPLIVDSDAVLALAAAPRNSQRKTAGAARSRLPLFHSQYADAARLKPHGARPW